MDRRGGMCVCVWRERSGGEAEEFRIARSVTLTIWQKILLGTVFSTWCAQNIDPLFNSAVPIKYASCALSAKIQLQSRRMWTGLWLTTKAQVFCDQKQYPKVFFDICPQVGQTTTCFPGYERWPPRKHVADTRRTTFFSVATEPGGTRCWSRAGLFFRKQTGPVRSKSLNSTPFGIPPTYLGIPFTQLGIPLTHLVITFVQLIITVTHTQNHTQSVIRMTKRVTWITKCVTSDYWMRKGDSQMRNGDSQLRKGGFPNM